MKISIKRATKATMTADEKFAASCIQAREKACPISEYKAMVTLALKRKYPLLHDIRIMEMDAYIVQNHRVVNAFDTGFENVKSGNLDVWILATVKSFDCYVEMGFSVSEFRSGTILDNQDLIRSIRYDRSKA